jgi:hemerythrin-like domain-containing protein
MTHEKTRPSDVRDLILAQHDHLRSLYAEVDALLARVQAGDHAAEPLLRERCRTVYQTLLRHMTVEDVMLAPALRETDGFGPLRADEMLSEHERQRRLLRYALSALDEQSATNALVQTMPPLLVSLRADMAHEERDLLDEDLLRDDTIVSDTMTG